MSMELSEEECESVQCVLELLDNLKDSVERYYDWAELLQGEFRAMKERVTALEARLDSMESVGRAIDSDGGQAGSVERAASDSDDDEGDLVGRLERLRGESGTR